MILRTTIGAFVASQETADAIEALREDRLFLRSTLIVQQGGIAAAASYLAEHDTPPVLVVETTSSGDALYQELENLANVCAPNTRVFLIGRQNDIELYRSLLREGISDYLIGPATSEQLLLSFRDAFTDADAADAGRVIAFAGARGGAGSSTLSHHVGFSLADSFSEQVIVIDLDVSYGTAALGFNLQARQTIADALSQPARLDEVLLERFLLPYDPSEGKLSVLASPASLAAGIVITSESLNKLISLARRMASRRTCSSSTKDTSTRSRPEPLSTNTSRGPLTTTSETPGLPNSSSSGPAPTLCRRRLASTSWTPASVTAAPIPLSAAATSSGV